MDLGHVGSRFTWRGQKWQGRERVFKRLDKALCNVKRRLIFHEAIVRVLPKVQSDHHPLCINLKGMEANPWRKPFRYFVALGLHENFHSLVSQAWNFSSSLNSNLASLSSTLSNWKKNVFGNVFRDKRRLMNRINGIQRSRDYGINPFLDRLEMKLRKDLEVILEREEILWLQKSRKDWLKNGDHNTKFYHVKTFSKRRKKKVSMLRNDSDEWLEEESRIKELVVQFYSSLFLEDSHDRPRLNSRMGFPRWDQYLINEECFSTQEIKNLLFAIGPLKAPGIDGFPALSSNKIRRWLRMSLLISSRRFAAVLT